MKFLADECCDGALVEALRADGHDVLFAAETMGGRPDVEVLTRAYDEDRILLTEDRDFGELVHRLRLPAWGIVYLRFSVADRYLKIPRLRTLLDGMGDRLPGSFVVLEPDRTRFRPLDH